MKKDYCFIAGVAFALGIIAGVAFSLTTLSKQIRDTFKRAFSQEYADTEDLFRLDGANSFDE